MTEVRIEVEYGERSVRYYADISHAGLNEYRRITGRDQYEVGQKASAQLAKWEERWSRRTAAQQALEGREAAKALALERTRKAEAVIESLAGILAHSLARDSTMNWEELKDYRPFPKPRSCIPQPVVPVETRIPPRPDPEDPSYQARKAFLDYLLPARFHLRKAAASALFYRDLLSWEDTRSRVDERNSAELAEYETAVASREAAVRQAEEEWNAERLRFERRQALHNAAIDDLRRKYLACDREAVIAHCQSVLSLSEYPSLLPEPAHHLGYDAESRVLAVEYRLPGPSDMPSTREVRYSPSRQEFEDVPLSEACRNRLYDSVIYQIALRTMHELFAADEAVALESIVFNGWVRSVDRSTGREVNACVISVQASKEEFAGINLSEVDPKECFRRLKGVGSARLHGLAAVAPILQLVRDDPRFVAHHEVAKDLDESVNLAAIDWEEFEHLIRELFEREFEQSGGEVKVTQASRDRGVDAVAFDPDPIRGGKIVIQAKRYTNTVDVSAVRDLYGTVLNEGATKGILVTTSNFGTDAYEFARGKPLTLLNGANLLHLLEKHGHKARIDLAEAKRMQN